MPSYTPASARTAARQALAAVPPRDAASTEKTACQGVLLDLSAEVTALGKPAQAEDAFSCAGEGAAPVENAAAVACVRE